MRTNTFRTLALCAALAAAAVACKKDNTPNEGEKAVVVPDMMLGGVTWASVNVDDYQTFAAKPDTYTKLYQWNRATAWSAADSVSEWSYTRDESATWTNNPCPAGWRLPTHEEFQALHNAGTTWAEANERGNAVAGCFYGANHATASLPNSMENCVFLPAVGFRYSSDGSLYLQGGNGYYWSATQSDSNHGYELRFDSTYSSSDHNSDKASGFPLRCVK